MNKNSRIFLSGHTGLVGSAILRRLIEDGYTGIITAQSKYLDLRCQEAVDSFFKKEQPEYVIMAAAKVGGVHANNTYRADFIYDNLAMQCNVIHASYVNKVKKLLFLGSNCLYPKLCTLPIKEEYLLAGKLEPTTEFYAIAKIAGIKMCQAYRDQYGCNFITALPVNMYGSGDNYNLETSHVMPALLSKFHTAKEKNSEFVEVWGSGLSKREFMHSDDLADACLFLMENYSDREPINVGPQEEISINDLAYTIKGIVGYNGEIKFNSNMPDGNLSKMLDVSKLHSLGWRHKIDLQDGIRQVYSEISKDKVWKTI